MNGREDNQRHWCKSSYSGTGNGNCVEVAVAASRVAVRDSKDPGRGSIELHPHAWQAFTGAQLPTR